jgi:hypothetical protein
MSNEQHFLYGRIDIYSGASGVTCEVSGTGTQHRGALRFGCCYACALAVFLLSHSMRLLGIERRVLCARVKCKAKRVKCGTLNMEYAPILLDNR